MMDCAWYQDIEKAIGESKNRFDIGWTSLKLEKGPYNTDQINP